MAPADRPVQADGCAGAAALQVELAWSTGPRQMHLLALTLPGGSTLKDALGAGGLWPLGQQGAELSDAHVGIWGRKASPDTPLRDGDRVECYRPLKVDPKEARRVRYRAHGEKLPKGIHRPKDRVTNLAHAPDQRLDDPGA